MGIIKAVCISDVRGVQKHPVPAAQFLPDWGIAHDAHGGRWHRQVSLLAWEEIEAFRARGAAVSYGDFGENMVVAGIPLAELPVGTQLRCDSVLLETTQIGKECHRHCAIYQAAGDCIMPRKGVFAKVRHGGTVHAGDPIEIVPLAGKRPYQAAVITLSDRGSQGLRADASGPVVAARLRAEGYDVIEECLLPDDAERLKKELCRLADQRQADLILTTGGTGFSPRDMTPEATLAVATRLAPGIAEAMRAASMTITRRAMLSRAVSVLRGSTLIINLPGSPAACRECMDVFMDTLPHGLDVLRGQIHDCRAETIDRISRKGEE